MAKETGLELKPDIGVLPNNPDEVIHLLNRERADMKKLLGSEDFLTPDVIREVGQIAVNIDYLLDHYPNGTPREPEAA